jgi:hypothetical protein
VIALRSRSFVFFSDVAYSEALTVVMTLASAAPIRVPATPKNEATTAEDTAARALAATWAALSEVFFGSSVEGRTAVSVRGEDMSSGDDAGEGTTPCRGYGDFLAAACACARSATP